MEITWIMLFTVVAVLEWPTASQNVLDTQGYSLPREAQYLVLAPRKVRPDMEYKLRVSMYNLFASEVRVRAVLSRNGEEYASSSTMFTQPTTKDISLDVPEFVMQGVHKLTVEGLVGTGVGQPMFFNETEVWFDTKYVSLFIQTDHPIYYPEQAEYDDLEAPTRDLGLYKVNFRVVGLTPDLKPIYGTLTIYVVDAGGHVVRRWLQKQLNIGVFESSFLLKYPVKTGTWKIRVVAFGHTYEQNFVVENFFYGANNRMLEVNCSTPIRIMNSEWGIIGQLYGEHLSGRPATGNATVQMRVMNANGRYLDNDIVKTIAYMHPSGFKETIPFELSMQEIEETWGDVAGKLVVFNASIYDWFLDMTAYGSSITKIYREGVVVRRIGPKFRTFKPGIPFTLQFAVAQRDNSPYQGFYNRQVEISRSHTGRDTNAVTSIDKVIIPDDGVLRYTVKPQPGDEQIIVNAFHPSSPANKAEIRSYKYFSPNEKYVSITSSTDRSQVNQYMVFTVHTNVHVSEVHYLIIGGGAVLLGDSVQMASRQRTFGVAVSRKMAPRARIVVYFMDNGEVVTDSLTFHVHDTRLYEASVRVNRGKDFSQDTLELVGFAQPGSYMMYSGIDYDIYHRGADTFLRVDNVIRELSSYDEPNQAPNEYIWWYDDDRWDQSVYFPAPTTAMDALMTFNTSGLVALSDRNMTLQPDWFGETTQCNRTLNNGQCPLSGGCYNFNETCDGLAKCRDGYDEAGCPPLPDDLPMPRPPDLEDFHRMSRHYSDVEWLWKTTYIMPRGNAQLTVEVPEARNPYVISGFALHPDEGLSLVTQPAQHDGTRTFFMAAQAPDSVKRGEQVGIRLALFNHWEERLEIIVMMHGHPDYRFVMVEDFGYTNSYAPKLSAGDHQIMVLLEAGENTYIHFPVVSLLETGTINVRFSALSFYDRDEDSVSIDVSMDGVGNGDHTPYLVDLVNQGSVIIPDFDSPIDEMFWQPEQTYHLYVPGSESAEYQLFGNVVSPGFFEPHFDTDLCIGVPHDSAEGYMFDFAINLQTLYYLQYSQALSTQARDNALEYMKDILMRQYAYMQDNGSFKMFRRDEQPCLWVTAFIGQTLHRGLASEWNEELFIEVELINQITIWVTSTQHEQGYFVETADVIYSRGMKPITIDRNGVEHEWHIPLTAYITIMLASLTRVTGAAKTEADLSKGRAAHYLAGKISQITDPFQMAITAYALQLADHRDKDAAIQRLDSLKIVSEFVYWASAPIAENPSEIINTVPLMQVRDYFSNLGDAVTATSYGLMLYLDQNRYDDSIPIMKWLQTQRNGLMKFSSTQDTLVALQALTEFALRETNRDIYRMLIILESTMSRDGEEPWHTEVHLNKSNFADFFTQALPIAYGQMKATAQGTGYAMLQMEYNQNTEKEWEVSGPTFDSYKIDIERIHFTGRNYSHMDARMCIQWIRPDIAPAAGLSVFLIGIPTGYVVSRDTVEEMYARQYPYLRRIRFRGGTLITMWELIPQEKVCVEFKASRWYPVANMTIQQPLNAYEYAETGLQKNWQYDTYSLHHLHICQVCGSYQCPFCAFYNSAPGVVMTTTTAMLFALLSMFVSLAMRVSFINT